MKFSDIEEGVHQVWQFIIPPTVYIFTLLLITYYVAPTLLLRGLAQLPLQGTFVLEDRQIREALDLYGVTKVLPVLAAVGAVFLLYVIRAVVLAVGQILPGHVAILTQARFKHAAGPERLATMWSLASTAEDENEAIRILLSKFEGADTALKSNVRSWADQVGKQYRLLSVAKVCLLWTLLLPWIAKANQSAANMRAVWLFGFGATLVGLYAVVRQVYAEEQLGFAQVDVVQRVLDATTPSESHRVARIEALKARLHQAEMSHDVPWWELRLVDVYFFRWLRQTFFMQRVRRHRRSGHRKRAWGLGWRRQAPPQ